MQSVWENSAGFPHCGRLTGSIKTDVLIIGGGIAGLLCAYKLHKAGVECTLVEANRICGGVTLYTTAKITSQHGLIYAKLIKQLGVERAKMYLDANETALKEYRRLCRKIKCGFEDKTAYVFSVDNERVLHQELEALDKLGYKARYEKKPPLPFFTVGAVGFDNQAQYNPMQFLSAISRGLNIYENTRVIKLDGHTAYTENGSIEARKIILATHFPFINSHGSYFIKMYQQRSYVIALENAADVDGMYIDEAKNGLSLRNYDGMLLVGGGGHRTGKQGGKWQELYTFARQYYPDAAIRYRWATQDCMTLDGVPYIGRCSANTPDLYVATGFNKWGMTSAMVASSILSDLVRDRKNEYAEVFSPSRSIIRPQLAVNAFEATANMLTPTTKRCTHLGCALKWNKLEHTWDCTCHGSRFTQSGTVIDNPANRNL